MEIIHIVLGKANPERMNGVNKVVYQLAARQSANGKKVSVWGITKSMERNFDERNFETRLYKAYRNPFRVSKDLKADLAKIKDKAVVHLHGGWIPAFYSLSRVLTLFRIPFVFTPHGAYNTIAMKRSWLLKKVYFQLFEKGLLRRSNRIHCIGESEVSGLNKIYCTGKTFLMPYGFDFHTGTGAERLTHNQQFIIGFVGRLDIYTKGLDLLLDAFVDFSGRCAKASIWIIGDSNERSRLDQMIIDRHLEENVIVWGSKFGKDKAELMQQMDVFVHPSRNEGLPSAVLEAAAQGIPCIVSKATNIGEYIEKYDAGRVVENEDVTGLKRTLEDLCDMKNSNRLEALGKNGKAMVEGAFNWTRLINELDRFYSAA